MKRFIQLLLVLMMVFSCNNLKSKDSMIKVDSKYTIINDSTEIKYLTNDFKEFWIPTQKDINNVDTTILKAIININKDNYKRLNASSYKDFYKQYVCYLNLNGDSIVFMNAVCILGPSIDANNNLTKNSNPYWRTNLIHTYGGSDCFWNIYILI